MNLASQYVDGVPAWWSSQLLETKYAKVSKIAKYLETICGVEEFKKKPVTGLMLYGDPGHGKTSAGIALLYEWGITGRHAKFQDFGELMIRIRSSWRKDAKETVESIHESMLKPSILMLDDINKLSTPEDKETLSTLVNSRINRGKPTICTTNCNLGTEAGRNQFLATADSRVLERFSGCDVDVKSENLRRQF